MNTERKVYALSYNLIIYYILYIYIYMYIYIHTLIFIKICFRSSISITETEIHLPVFSLCERERIIMDQNEVIKNLRSCLISCKGGIKLENLRGKYYRLLLSIITKQL